MAYVIVLSDDRQRCMLDQNVTPDHLEDVHRSLKVIERIAAAVNHAHDRDPLGLSPDHTRFATHSASCV